MVRKSKLRHAAPANSMESDCDDDVNVDQELSYLYSECSVLPL